MARLSAVQASKPTNSWLSPSPLRKARSAPEMDAVRGFLHDWRVVLLMIHVGVTAAMIFVILLQRSEGGGLGMGRTDALFSVRGQANVLSRMTAIFATAFFALSLLMAWSTTDTQRGTRSIIDRLPAGQAAPGAPAAGGAAPAPAGQSQPSAPA